MLQDKSDDFSETWDFLDRRLEDLGMIGSVQKNSNELGTILSGLAITAKNMAGRDSLAPRQRKKLAATTPMPHRATTPTMARPINNKEYFILIIIK